MPSTRSERRVVAKRTIVGQEDIMSASNGLINKHFDSSKEDHVRLLLDDIEHKLKQKQQAITNQCNIGKQMQQQACWNAVTKIKKAVRNMTVREFDEKYNCDVLQMLKDVTTLAQKSSAQRVMATPAPVRAKKGKVAPGSIARTVRRGERVFSQNGSPVDQVEEGALVATVVKRRRGDSAGSSAAFDINVGDGRYINLADPSTVKHLDDDMKNTAMSQLKIMQGQMESLMAQLASE